MEHAVDLMERCFYWMTEARLLSVRTNANWHDNTLWIIYFKGGFLMRTIIFQALEFTVLIPGMLLAYLPVTHL